jgi:hypothetical protein
VTEIRHELLVPGTVVRTTLTTWRGARA